MLATRFKERYQYKHNVLHNPGVVSWRLLGHIKLLCGPFTPFLKTSDTYLKMNESQPDNKRLEFNGEQDSVIGSDQNTGCIAQETCFYCPQRKRLVNFSKESAQFVGPNHPQFNSNLDGFYPVWV
jgi:hypothetical protein